MDSELRQHINRETTHCYNALGTIRSGQYYTEEQVLDVITEIRKRLHHLVNAITYPQMRLWEERSSGRS